MESTEDKTPALPRHFYSLDALRGLAALIVVFWHWQHFFVRGTEITNFSPKQQPLYWLFVPFYTDGWRAVDLFFCLSGFIFYWLYSEKIWTRETSMKEFVVLRFSRLYPLHFLTLLIVVAGQRVLLWLTGSVFVFSNNDPYHFLLQLVFASNWGFERGYSFNGPIWSVSVEVLIYAVFCLLCLGNFRRWWQLAILTGFGYFLNRIGHGNLGKGFFSFFAGGMGFYVFIRIWRRTPSRVTLQKLAATTGLLWALVMTNMYVKDAFGHVLVKPPRFFFELVLYPLTLITLALWEAHRGTLGRRVAFLGHLSYSSYLLHFPLQMLFVGVAFGLAIPRTFFCTPYALGLFIATLIGVSLSSYYYFERPVQSLIRKWLLPARKPTTRDAPARTPDTPNDP
jgi:peptidoglycan/LPS O-acetylase OafA/YrhL